MAKPKVEREVVALNVPEILECDLHSFERETIALLIDEAREIRERLKEKVTDEEYDKSFHLTRRYKEIREELAEIQAAEGMIDGLRHGSTIFRCRMVNGRKTVNNTKLKENLLHYLTADQVMKVIEESSVVGDDYYVKELVDVE